MPRMLLVCDHASNAIPARLGRLGMAETDLVRHIAYDIGAAAVTRLLSRSLAAPAVLSGYSRLVVDCNRALDDLTLMPEMSDGTAVPANRDLTEAERQRRLDACFWPYHAAIEAEIERFAEAGIEPVVLSIHSFTPTMDGLARPWHLGVLWDNDPRVPRPLLAGLRAIEGLVIGDNEPYSARDPHGYTIERHAMPRDLPHALIEIRQDEIATEAGAARVAQLLHDVLVPIMADDPARQAFSRR